MLAAFDNHCCDAMLVIVPPAKKGSAIARACSAVSAIEFGRGYEYTKCSHNNTQSNHDDLIDIASQVDLLNPDRRFCSLALHIGLSNDEKVTFQPEEEQYVGGQMHQYEMRG